MTDPNFYLLQNEWSNIYFREVDESDYKKVGWVERIIPHPFRKIMELGAGGGQFSIALARQNYSVTTLEKESEFVNHIKAAIKEKSLKTLKVIQADFHKVYIKEKFDLICYWDGFGLSEDNSQQSLLKRIATWLKPESSVLLEVYSPWYWS
ncbi:MAG TPA: methyltransferase domain-containing protein, partial [Anaerolineaceae bacterium]|nr:methyltransferase domain-containing protein [Anaerolineaceae bacterium]